MTITQIIGVIFVCFFFCCCCFKNLDHIGDLFEINGKMRSWENLRAKLDLNDNGNFTVGKLYTQSLVLGKKLF